MLLVPGARWELGGKAEDRVDYDDDDLRYSMNNWIHLR